MVSVERIVGMTILASFILAVAAGCALPAGAARGASSQDAHAGYGAAWLHIYSARSRRARDPAAALAHWQAARDFLEKADREDPYEPEIAAALALCYVRFNQFPQAARVLVQARSFGPGEGDGGLLGLLDSVPGTGHVLAAFDEALVGRKLPAGRRGRLLRDAGAYCLRRRRPQDALRFYNLALEEGEPDASLVRLAVAACAAAGDAERGIELCTQFLNERQDLDAVESVEMVERLAAFYELAKRPEQGAEALAALQRRAPDNELVCRLRVLLLVRADRKDRASDVAQAFLAAHRDAVRLKLVLAEFTMAADPERAEGLLRDVMKRRPLEWQAWTMLAHLHWGAGRKEEAIGTLRAFPVDEAEFDAASRIRMSTAHFLEQSGKVEEAIAELKKNLEQHPADPETCNHLGYLYAERGIHLDEAERLVKIALRAEPESGAYLDSLGWTYYKMALRDDNPVRMNAAAVLLAKALVHRPHDPVITDHLADVRYVGGFLKEAADGWQAALDAAADDPEGLPNRDEVEAKLRLVRSRLEGADPASRRVVRPLKPPPLAPERADAGSGT